MRSIKLRPFFAVIPGSVVNNLRLDLLSIRARRWSIRPLYGQTGGDAGESPSPRRFVRWNDFSECEKAKRDHCGSRPMWSLNSAQLLCGLSFRSNRIRSPCQRRKRPKSHLRGRRRSLPVPPSPECRRRESTHGARPARSSTPGMAARLAVSPGAGPALPRPATIQPSLDHKRCALSYFWMSSPDLSGTSSPSPTEPRQSPDWSGNRQGSG